MQMARTELIAKWKGQTHFPKNEKRTRTRTNVTDDKTTYIYYAINYQFYAARI